MSNRPDIRAQEREWQHYGFVRQALHGSKQYVEQLSLPRQPTLTGAMVPVPSLGWAAGAFVPQEQVVGPVRKMALNDLAITVVVIALTFLVGSIIAKQMTAPVEHLSDAAEKLGKGELDMRVPVTGATELRTLARTMNQMAESVQQAYERERRIATTLQQRIRIPDMDGNPPSKNALAEMSMRDRSALCQEMLRVDAGINTPIELDCDSCGARIGTRLEAEPGFLFPGVRS